MRYLKPFVFCFGIILLLELAVLSFPVFGQFRIVTKPMVVGSLLIFFLLQKVDRKTKSLVSMALILSLIGDMFLIYGDDESLFACGVFAFLLAHIMYIIQFSRSRNKSVGILAPLLVLLFYACAIFWYLSDSLQNMTLPVALYIMVMLIMILFAYLRDDSLTDNSYIYILAGALMFMLSDSILAITRFKSDIPYSGILVMGIYGIAQFLMLIGILKGATSKIHETPLASYSS